MLYLWYTTDNFPVSLHKGMEIHALVGLVGSVGLGIWLGLGLARIPVVYHCSGNGLEC